MDRARDLASGGLECAACHAAWQPNCIGCHIELTYDDTPVSEAGSASATAVNAFFSKLTGERVFANVTTTVLAQNPLMFVLGINARGKIGPMTSTAHKNLTTANAQNADTNNADVTRPLTAAILNHLAAINANGGLTDVYYYNDQPGSSPDVNGHHTRFLTDLQLQ